METQEPLQEADPNKMVPPSEQVAPEKPLVVGMT